jgi:enoyl-CoA hydratase/carnithine racemase
MALVEYALDGYVAVVTMNDGENWFNPAFMDAFMDVLDGVENETPATTLVVTSAHEKIFSNGIDLAWLEPRLENDLLAAKRLFYQLNRMFKRVLNYPLVTVAAMNGHAFAGGAIFSCAFDFRFMRSDRGFFCLPAVDRELVFLPGMNALLERAVPPWLLHEMQMTGERLTADTLAVHHVVRAACPIDQLMETALAFARRQDKKRSTVAEIKRRRNGAVVRALDIDDVPYIESGQFIFLNA